MCPFRKIWTSSSANRATKNGQVHNKIAGTKELKNGLICNQLNLISLTKYYSYCGNKYSFIYVFIYCRVWGSTAAAGRLCDSRFPAPSGRPRLLARHTAARRTTGKVPVDISQIDNQRLLTYSLTWIPSNHRISSWVPSPPYHTGTCGHLWDIYPPTYF